MSEKTVHISQGSKRDRESFPRLQAVMPVTKLVRKPTLQIIDGKLVAVVA